MTPSTEPTLRPATIDDAAAISVLVGLLSRHIFADLNDPAAVVFFLTTINHAAIAGTIASGKYRYHLAELDGAPVGVVAIRDGRHRYHLFVAEAFHRRGLARRLWLHARADAERQGPVARWTVSSSLYARPVYERFGFVATDPPQIRDGVAFVPIELVES